MLIFHEGIPRSGKTYEAVAKHLIPALKKGRRCFVRIDALNFEQLASLAEITLEKCQSILTHLDEEQILCLHEYEMPVGSLVIVDELQNYFPDTGRKPLSTGITKFVAEHGHNGLDIVFMGQDLRDCHKIWRRRVDTKINFTKMDMVGKPTKYKWSLSKATQPEKFKHVANGTADYDPAIFGSYKSFEPGAEEAQKYDDKRQNIFNSKAFKQYIPYCLVALGLAGWYLYSSFKGGGLEKSLGGQHAGATPTMSAPAASSATLAKTTPAVPVPEKKYEKDFVQDLSERYRLRLSAVIRGQGKMTAMFEWFDDGLRSVEHLTMVQLTRLGYEVLISPELDSATITKGKVMYVATQFPLETTARVSDARQREIAGGDRADSGSGTPISKSGSGGSVQVIGDEDGYGVLGKRTGRSAGGK